MKPRPGAVFWIAAAYYLCLSIVPDKRAFIVLAAAAVYILFRITGSVYRSLLLGYFINIPVTVGKKWIVDLIPAGTLSLPGRPFGISADFLLTLTDVMTVLMGIMLLLAIGNPRIRRAAGSWMFVWLALLPVAMLVSTFAGSVYPAVSVLHVWQFVKPVITFLFIVCFVRDADRQEVYAVIAAICIFEASLIGLQTLRGSTLGLAVEEFPQYTPIDYSADAGTYGITRTGGTFGHANSLAHAMSFLVPLLFPFLVSKLRAVRAPAAFGWGAIAGMICLIFTMSRSAWIGSTVAALVYLFVAEKIWKQPMRFALRITRAAGRLLMVISLAAGFLIFIRTASTLSTFAQYGSGQTRIELLRASLPAIEDNWYFGVGLEMDAYYLYSRSQAVMFAGRAKQSVLAYFPEPPHNGFVRLLLQTGVVGTLSYAAVFFSLIVVVFRSTSARTGSVVRFGHLAVLVAVVSVVINSMLQPHIPDLQMLVAVSMILGHRREGSLSA